MPFGFVGRKILITGAGRGIGRALAIAVVKSGGEVYALSRQQAHLDSLVKEYPEIKSIQCDLSDWDSTQAKLEKLGTIDGLVNNAGVLFGGQTALHTSKELFDQTLAVNLYAAVNTMQVIGKKMVNAGQGGSIVNVSSILGLSPALGAPQYNISKAALDMATKQFALELGPHQIRVNSVNPTVVVTDLAKGLWGDPVNPVKILEKTALGRVAEVHEIVGPILYQLSDASSMVTGTVNPIEGGLLSNITV